MFQHWESVRRVSNVTVGRGVTLAAADSGPSPSLAQEGSGKIHGKFQDRKWITWIHLFGSKPCKSLMCSHLPENSNHFGTNLSFFRSFPGAELLYLHLLRLNGSDLGLLPHLTAPGSPDNKSSSLETMDIMKESNSNGMSSTIYFISF